MQEIIQGNHSYNSLGNMFGSFRLQKHLLNEMKRPNTPLDSGADLTSGKPLTEVEVEGLDEVEVVALDEVGVVALDEVELGGLTALMFIVFNL